MSTLSMIDESITSKDDNYYVNLCSGANKVKEVNHKNGFFSTFHEVEEKIVELIQRAVPNWDDVDYELDEVIIHNNLPY